MRYVWQLQFRWTTHWHACGTLPWHIEPTRFLFDAQNVEDVRLRSLVMPRRRREVRRCFVGMLGRCVGFRVVLVMRLHQFAMCRKRHDVRTCFVIRFGWCIGLHIDFFMQRRCGRLRRYALRDISLWLRRGLFLAWVGVHRYTLRDISLWLRRGLFLAWASVRLLLLFAHNICEVARCSYFLRRVNWVRLGLILFGGVVVWYCYCLRPLALVVELH